MATLAAAVLGTQPDRWRRRGGGHTRAQAWLVAAEGEPAFVKVASEPSALAFLRNEHAVLGAIAGSFAPRVHGFREEDGVGVLVLEGLEHAHWPPPYPADVTPLFDALDELGRTTAPPESAGEPVANLLPLWPRVAADPAPLLALGVCSARWLERALPALVAAEERAVLTGTDLVHADVWHGNLCFDGRRAVLVDWAFAGPGNHWFDVACAVASVRALGGEPPALELPGGDALAAVLAGIHAVEAPQPLPEWTRDDAGLRDEQAGALRVELAWAAELLGLPPPDGA